MPALALKIPIEFGQKATSPLLVSVGWEGLFRNLLNLLLKWPVSVEWERWHDICKKGHKRLGLRMEKTRKEVEGDS